MNEAPPNFGEAPRAFWQGPRRRRWLLTLGAALTLSACFVSWLYLAQSNSQVISRAGNHASRIVSLSPGVTETIEVLGAGPLLVGISDYCRTVDSPSLPRAGTALTPNYEVIAQLNPDAIVTSEVKGAQLGPLEKLAPTHQLPWLSLSEWARSVVTLGQIIGKPNEAHKLQQKILATLDVRSAPGAPRILLALDYGDTGSDETWFIRENSIHGAVLRAAGARNAVEGKVLGQPKLSPERLLEVDPEAIIVLTSDPKRSEADALRHFGKWAPLVAVKNKHIGVLSVPSALTVGPSVLKLVPLLRNEITSVINGKR